jgi:membrane-associated HD superfamily phosphohydrolase
VLGAIVAGFLFLCAWARIVPQNLDLVEGDIAPDTIRAPRSGMYVDEDEMRRIRQEAEEAVPEVYFADPNATEDALQALDDIFDAFSGTRSDARIPSVGEKVAHLQSILDIRLDSSTLQLATSTSTSESALLRLKENCADLVRAQMAGEIRSNSTDLDAAREVIAERARDLGLTSRYSVFVASISRAVLKANRVLDVEATAKAQQARTSRVKDVYHTLQPGDVIVLAGEEIRPRHIAAFESVGLKQARVDYAQALAILLAFAVMVLGLGTFARRYARRSYTQYGCLVAICAQLVMSALICRVLEPTSWFESGAMTIAVVNAIVVAMLYDPLLALGVSVFVAMMVPIIAAGSDARLGIRRLRRQPAREPEQCGGGVVASDGRGVRGHLDDEQEGLRTRLGPTGDRCCSGGWAGGADAGSGRLGGTGAGARHHHRFQTDGTGEPYGAGAAEVAGGRSGKLPVECNGWELG